jgi:hypothetical protein
VRKKAPSGTGPEGDSNHGHRDPSPTDTIALTCIQDASFDVRGKQARAVAAEPIRGIKDRDDTRLKGCRGTRNHWRALQIMMPAAARLAVDAWRAPLEIDRTVEASQLTG